MHDRYADQVEFVAVYVREAHAGDGAWPMEFKMETGGAINQPTVVGQRVDVACECCKVLDISMPLLVDDVDDRVGRAYSGMPDRLYVIDRDGKVAYKGGRGPFGFRPGEMEQSLVMLLLETLSDEPASVAQGTRAISCGSASAAD